MSNKYYEGPQDVHEWMIKYTPKNKLMDEMLDSSYGYYLFNPKGKLSSQMFYHISTHVRHWKTLNGIRKFMKLRELKEIKE
jgi:hypothetical protein